MSVITRGFGGREDPADPALPPGQYLTDDFPVLSAGPTPHVDTADWLFEVADADGSGYTLDWQALMDLPSEEITVDLHCVTRWSKFATTWRGVPVSEVLGRLDLDTEFAMVRSYGGYTTNLPVEDLIDDKAWIAFEYEGDDLSPEHGGPARLLVPHLYLWKSAKWVNGIRLMEYDQPGFWETLGYHEYGDPWLEQRYVGD